MKYGEGKAEGGGRRRKEEWEEGGWRIEELQEEEGEEVPPGQAFGAQGASGRQRARQAPRSVGYPRLHQRDI